MAKGIAMGIFFFAVTIGLFANFFAIGDIDPYDSDQLKNDLDSLMTGEGEETRLAGFLNIMWGILPPATGVVWFDLLVWGGMGVGLVMFILDVAPVIG